MLPAASQFDTPPGRHLPPANRRVDAHPPGEILSGDRFGGAADVFGRALGDDSSSVSPGGRAHVDYLVGGADRLFVVLDHDHGVADI
ncbi:MAG: hypothetical protein KAJ12_06440, partial [Bacteroidetes bacterium]|nr:hypothetical protein [Bacteroidota bacterium]